jgi:hypothetical protein
MFMMAAGYRRWTAGKRGLFNLSSLAPRDKPPSSREEAMAHRLRSAVRAAEAGATLAPLSLEPCRRDPHAPPPDGQDSRARPRRRAERHRGLVESAALLYRGKPALVRVANVSQGGVTLETGLTPEIGEIVSVAMEGHKPRGGIVRWVRRGRVGLDLDPE